MINNYLEGFFANAEGTYFHLMDIASDETEKIKKFLKGELVGLPVADATVEARYRSLRGLKAMFNDETHRNYYGTFLETYGDNGYENEYTVVKDSTNMTLSASDSIPYTIYDSWFVIISSVPYVNLKENPSLVDSEFLVAYGVNFVSNNGTGDDDDGGGGAIEVNIPPINPSQYIKSLTADGGSIDLSDVVGDESEFLANLFSGNESKLMATNYYTLSKTIEGIVLELKEEYQNYKIAAFKIFGVGQNMMDVNQTFEYTQDTYRNVTIPYEVIDDPLLYDTFLFIITSVDFEEFIENPTLFDSEFIGAFGLTFLYDENVEDELPPEIINPTDLDATQYVRVLNGTTLAEYSKVPDVYNVKISQQINGLHTLTFNLLPYTNASNIYTPRIVEVDNDYFHVQQITKRHELQNLEMDIYCEHVSYELNYPPSNINRAESVSTMATSNSDDEYEWTEDTYEGTAREILEELLQYNSRFTIGLVEDTQDYLFTTKAEGYRTRINEFAEFIGLEVKWNKFTVALLKKRGHDNGLILEVGKNIIGLTEVIDTTKLGRVKRSYELDVIDLNYVKDELENPLETHNISLGDVVTILDEQYRISRKDRVVGLTRDPFKKALPTIEFTNTMSSYTANGNSGTGGAAVDLKIYQEDIYRGQFANAFGKDVRAAGVYSLAEGEGSKAYGTRSHAEGRGTEAWGTNGHSEGSYSKANGYSSHAEGSGTIASGEGAHSEGGSSYADGHWSHSEGYGTKAVGQCSHAEGGNTEARGRYSHSEGWGTYAIGEMSHARGGWTQARGPYSTAIGYQTMARHPGQTAIGRNNRENWEAQDEVEWNIQHRAFIIGNGGFGHVVNTGSNCFSVRFDGVVQSSSSFNSTGADYSEYFEWTDGNPNNEERRGYVTTLEGDKIRLANSKDGYILGIVSANPSIVGNAHEDQWKGMYMLDEWGTVQCEYVDAPHKEIDERGNENIVYRKTYSPILNPNYNEDAEYIPRSQRPEWDAIGMLGKLLVHDDGTCQINKYAKLSETVDGILSHSDTPTQFFVLRRINDELVEVLIK